MVNEHYHLSVEADATKLPELFEVSIEGLEAGSQVTAGDVQLPDGRRAGRRAGAWSSSPSPPPTAEQLELAEGEETAEGRPRAREAAEGSAGRGLTEVRRATCPQGRRRPLRRAPAVFATW